MSAKRKRKIPMAVEGPAIIAPDHAQNRPFALETEGRGRPQVAPVKGWRRLSPLEQAFLKGQLAGGAAAHDAEARFAAGKRYGEMFALAQSSGRDSTDLDRISTSTGSGGISDSQSAAIRKLIAVDSRMSPRDRQIVRLVCGEGYFPSEAVRQVCADYKHTIPARLREALDGLVEAFAAARREKGGVRLA